MSSADVARLVFGYLSERGLEETKNAFFKESQDLLGSALEIDAKEGRKLTSIVEEYFLSQGCGDLSGQIATKKEEGFNALIAHAGMLFLYQPKFLEQLLEKKGKAVDPESVLLSLWKQFDVLVGQLKHSTIYNSAKDKTKVKRNFRDQKARVRELNKQNWVALQQKNKSLAAAQRGIQPKHGVVCATVTSPQCFPSISTQYIHVEPYPTAPQAAHLQNGSEITVTKAATWKAPAKKEHCTVGVVHSDVISQSILNSSEPLQSFNENLLPADPFKSPKRKSVPPKKRNGETVPAIPPAQVSTKTTPIASTPSFTPEDSQFDIQCIVDKILGRPELPEKLAENINRAVEIDALPSQESDFNTETKSSTQAQTAVVNSNKVDNIMEMMKSDPVFQELFSSFENFESICEESETVLAKESDPKTSNPSNSLGGDECANEALDALLLLANSPVKPAVQTSDFLETPRKTNTSTVLTSTAVSPTSSVPVILSPGDSDPIRRLSLPHVRQLNFTRTGETSSNSSTSQDVGSGDDKSATTSEVIIIPEREIIENIACGEKSCEIIASRVESSQQKKKSSEIISEGEAVKGQDSGKEEVIFVRCEDLSAEECSDKTNNKVGVVDKQDIIEKEKLVGNNPVVFQSEEKKCSSETGCKERNAKESEDLVCCNNNSDPMRTRTTYLGMSDTERSCDKNKTINDSPLKLSVLEDLAVNEFLQNRTIETTETRSPLKSPQRVRKSPLMKSVNEEESRKTKVMLCDPMEVENISTKPEDTKNTSTKVSEGLTTLTEEFVSCTGGFTNIKTPESKNSPANDLSSSAESDKTSKRKLKRKKKSTRTSKKAKIIPADLDVDKFLSSLHYVEDEKRLCDKMT